MATLCLSLLPLLAAAPCGLRVAFALSVMSASVRGLALLTSSRPGALSLTVSLTPLCGMPPLTSGFAWFSLMRRADWSLGSTGNNPGSEACLDRLVLKHPLLHGVPEAWLGCSAPDHGAGPPVLSLGLVLRLLPQACLALRRPKGSCLKAVWRCGIPC